MKSHSVTSQISRQDIAAVAGALKALRRATPFLVMLPAKERRRRELRVRNLTLAEHALEGVRENRAVLPPYFDFEQFEHDVHVTRGLYDVVQELKQLVADLQTTLAVTGSEVVKGSGAVCAHLKAAARTTSGLKGLTQQLAALKNGSSTPSAPFSVRLQAFPGGTDAAQESEHDNHAA